MGKENAVERWTYFEVGIQFAQPTTKCRRETSLAISLLSLILLEQITGKSFEFF